MRIKFPRLLAGLLALIMAFSLAACGAETPAAPAEPTPAAETPAPTPEPTPAPTPEATPEPVAEPEPEPEAEPEAEAAAVNPELQAALDEFMARPLNAPVAEVSTPTNAADSATPIVSGYERFSERFSPFFYQSGYDSDAMIQTQITTYALDRAGAIIYNGIEGETRSYNGVDYFYQTPFNLFEYFDETTDTGYYRIRMRDDLKFSDGVPATIDDLIFDIYAMNDPDYNGLYNPSQLYAVKGLQAYRTQVEDSVYAELEPVVAALYAAGDAHEWASSDAWDQATQDSYWTGFKTMWMETCQQIVDYVVANYTGMLEEGDLGPYTADDVAGNPGVQTLMGMLFWGYGAIENNIFTTPSGATFDLAAEALPTIEDYYNETYAAYGGDFIAYWDVEKTSETDSGQGSADAYNAVIIRELADAQSGGGGGIPNIAGITRIDDYTVEFQTSGYDSTINNSIFGTFSLAPLHYYGDPAQYDYANNKFGFPYGDLSILREKTTRPVGAGPYMLTNFENETVYYEANPNYWQGEPATKYMQFKYVPGTEMVPGVGSGVTDLGEFSYTAEREAEISGYNATGTMEGEVMDTRSVMNRGYGYIGIYAPSVSVEGDIGSDASKNLRKGLATILAVHRDVAINSYYGPGASLLEYPVSSISWASPQPTDEGYEVAYSKDVSGNPIYTADMTADQRYEAAKTAALGFFEAAGFTVADGKVTAGPGDGVRETVYDGDLSYLEYEVIVPGAGAGDHPSFALLTDAAATFAEIGISLIVNDPADTNVLWDNKDAGTTDMFCAAWGNSQADAHIALEQTYLSTSRAASGMTEYNDYGVESPVIDEALAEARKSSDQAYRKSLYKTVLEEVMDWGVEVPVYQRRIYYVFSSERINMDTLNEGISPFVLAFDAPSGNNIHKVEMK